MLTWNTVGRKDANPRTKFRDNIDIFCWTFLNITSLNIIWENASSNLWVWVIQWTINCLKMWILCHNQNKFAKVLGLFSFEMSLQKYDGWGNKAVWVSWPLWIAFFVMGKSSVHSFCNFLYTIHLKPTEIYADFFNSG